MINYILLRNLLFASALSLCFLCGSCGSGQQPSESQSAPNTESAMDQPEVNVAEVEKSVSADVVAATDEEAVRSFVLSDIEEDDTLAAVKLFNSLYRNIFDSGLCSDNMQECLDRAKAVPMTDPEFFPGCAFDEMASNAWLYYIIDEVPASDSIVPKDIAITKMGNDSVKIHYRTLQHYRDGQMDGTTSITIFLLRENDRLVVDEMETRWGTSIKCRLVEYIEETSKYLRSDDWKRRCNEYSKEHEIGDYLLSVEEYFTNYTD